MTDREPSSPVCYAGEADARYAGYLEESEARALLARLRESECLAAKEIAALLPRIKDDRLHAALKSVLEAHERNLASLEALLPTPAKER